MNDQIIDAAMAQAIQADANRVRALYGWIILRELPEHPGRLVARFAIDHPTVYVIVAETLASIHEQLPPGLDHSPRRLNDPAEVVETWFSRTSNCGALADGVSRTPECCYWQPKGRV